MLTKVINQETRLTKRMSMRRFAALLDVCHATVFNNEHGTPTLDYARRMRNVFGNDVYGNFNEEVALELVEAGEQVLKVMREFKIESMTIINRFDSTGEKITY